MKKLSEKSKNNKSPKLKSNVSKTNDETMNGEPRTPVKNQSVTARPPRAIQKTPKKAPEAGGGAIGKIITKIGQFLREAKVELKKVKWPTRKELLASTVVVIVLTLLVAFYLGLVDFGLIKIIRNVVG